MDRLHVLKALSERKNLKNYLEIGVFNGHIFFKINSWFKVAVDPYFAFDGLRKLGKSLLQPANFKNQYFEKPSDDFFEQNAPVVFADKKIELALIDGMHEYDFVLRDAQNTLKYLDEKGVIILHDCNPVTATSAVSHQAWVDNGHQGVWNGDVWKMIVFFRSFHPELDVFVLDCDHGLGVITKKPTENRLHFTEEQIRGFSYEDLAQNRQAWLDLKPADYFEDYFFNLRQ